jgi:hypothetical protein
VGWGSRADGPGRYGLGSGGSLIRRRASARIANRRPEKSAATPSFPFRRASRLHATQDDQTPSTAQLRLGFASPGASTIHAIRRAGGQTTREVADTHGPRRHPTAARAEHLLLRTDPQDTSALGAPAVDPRIGIGKAGDRTAAHGPFLATAAWRRPRSGRAEGFSRPRRHGHSGAEQGRCQSAHEGTDTSWLWHHHRSA